MHGTHFDVMNLPFMHEVLALLVRGKALGQRYRSQNRLDNTAEDRTDLN